MRCEHRWPNKSRCGSGAKFAVGMGPGRIKFRLVCHKHLARAITDLVGDLGGSASAKVWSVS